ncbi:MAG: hypothetical protein ACTSQA_09250 [Candidatus Heimdallarchaeaceae archaeon]
MPLGKMNKKLYPNFSGMPQVCRLGLLFRLKTLFVLGLMIKFIMSLNQQIQKLDFQKATNFVSRAGNGFRKEFSSESVKIEKVTHFGNFI